MVGYSDADFAADKGDRKSVTGGFITIDGMPGELDVQEAWRRITFDHEG